MTRDHVAQLLASGAVDPVMYVLRDEDGVSIAVGSEFRVNDRHVIAHHHEAVDELGSAAEYGEEPSAEDVASYVEFLQGEAERIAEDI
ncbi:hypothetical protein ACFY0G_02165 [Streptomyces sp. NPDC001552]|uniref:hypothetical protein n=1 Tax=Streptomyces sp. NPDC001552 TaxID=3364587 RepID=UPI0036BE87CE